MYLLKEWCFLTKSVQTDWVSLIVWLQITARLYKKYGRQEVSIQWPVLKVRYNAPNLDFIVSLESYEWIT